MSTTIKSSTASQPPPGPSSRQQRLCIQNIGQQDQSEPQPGGDQVTWIRILYHSMALSVNNGYSPTQLVHHVCIYIYIYSHDMKWPWIAGITPFSKQGISFSCSGLSSEVSTYSMAWGKETTNHGLFHDTRGNTAKVPLNRLMLWRTLKR